MPEDTLEGKQLTKKCTHYTQNIVYKQLFKKKYVFTEVSHISALNIAVLPLLLKACWDGALTTSGGNEFQLSDAKQVWCEMKHNFFFFFIIIYTVGIPVVWATFCNWWCTHTKKKIE